MSSTNHTVTHEACQFMRKIQWKTEFFTPTVYTNVLLNAVVNALVCPVTTVFNGVFIMCIILKTESRNQKSTLLLACLALTDLLVGAVVQPMFVASAVCGITEICRYSQEIANVVCFLVAICSFSSFFHVTLIAVDRYVAITHAFQYTSLITTKMILAGSVTAWVLPVLMVCMSNYFDVAKKVLMMVLLIISGAVVYIYVAIYFESRRHHRMIIDSIPHQGANHLRQKQEFKASKTTALIFGCLALCYAPSYLAQAISIFILPTNSSNVSLWLCVFLWTKTMMMLNSLCNPFIYGRRVPRFRETITNIFQALRDTNHPQQKRIGIN